MTISDQDWVDLADQLNAWKQKPDVAWNKFDDFGQVILICRDFQSLVKQIAGTPAGAVFGNLLPYAVAFVLLGPLEIFKTDTGIIQGTPTNWNDFLVVLRALPINKFKPPAKGVPQAVELVVAFGLGWKRNLLPRETDPLGWNKLWGLAGALVALKHVLPHLKNAFYLVKYLIGYQGEGLPKSDWRNTASMYALIDFPKEINGWNPLAGNLQAYMWARFVGSQLLPNIKLLNKTGFLMGALEANLIATRGASTSQTPQPGVCPALPHVEGLPKPQTQDLLHPYNFESDEMWHCQTCNSFFQVVESGKPPQLETCSEKRLSQRSTRVYFRSQEYFERWTRQYRTGYTLGGYKPGLTESESEEVSTEYEYDEAAEDDGNSEPNG